MIDYEILLEILLEYYYIFAACYETAVISWFKSCLSIWRFLIDIEKKYVKIEIYSRILLVLFFFLFILTTRSEHKQSAEDVL